MFTTVVNINNANKGIPNTMARKAKTFNNDMARVKEIIETLRVNANNVNMDVDEHKKAKDAASKAGDAVASKRVQIMFDIADLSIAGDWTASEILQAGPEAARGNQELTKDNSVKTFIYEISYAAHPMVRDNFRTLYEVVEQAWQDEQTQIEGAPKPLQKWAKRKYHALTGVMKAAINDNIVIHDAQTLIDYAIDNDPDLSASKVFKKLTQKLDDLRSFYTDFPVDDIAVAIEALERVETKHLQAAQERKHALTMDAVQDIKDNTPALAPAPAPAHTSVSPNTSVVNTKTKSPFVTTPASVSKPVPVPVDALADMVDNLTDDDNLTNLTNLTNTTNTDMTNNSRAA